MDFGLSADDPRALAPEALAQGFDALPELLEALVPAAAGAAKKAP